MASIKAVEAPRIPQDIERQLLSIEMVPVAQLFIDSAYQRDLDSARTKRMAADWNWLACGSLTVSLRVIDGENKYAVIDGQQRLNAIKLQGFKEAPCRIYIDLTETQEAELFEVLNAAKKPGYNDIFKSRLSRGEEKARHISTAVEQVGYHLDPERKRKSNASYLNGHWYIQSMREMEKMYERGGSIHIMEVLKLYKALYGGEHVGMQQLVLAGISEFITKYKTIKREELIEKLRRNGLDKTIQLAYQWAAVHGKGRGSSSGIHFAEAMLNIYNQNRREENKIKSKNL